MSDRPLLLVTNDDGIDSEGIRLLAETAARIGDVFICAPNGQRSAASMKLTLGEPIEVVKTDFPGENIVGAYAFSGTPADCVRVGVKNFMPRYPDAVLSGVNAGYNVGYDICYSGTVGAAREGTFLGIHAIAFSEHKLSDHEIVRLRLEDDIRRFLDRRLPAGCFWNINYPACAVSEYRGALEDRRIAPQRMYDGNYAPFFREGDRWLIQNQEAMQTMYAPEGTDIRALADNFCSISILSST